MAQPNLHTYSHWALFIFVNKRHYDSPEITGRGVLLSFYVQGFLMGERFIVKSPLCCLTRMACINKVTNGVLDIELVPSVVTTLVICVTLLYGVFKAILLSFFTSSYAFMWSLCTP
jgi:hypothetical protein